jgi:alkanesulfonate monooxygenase SsuD/methylene tetrahydromethanopterin reductase-like flavin-dependent oxidoreductase (luciferase family)
LEIFVTLGFLAAVTDRVMLETGIVIPPERPPVLVARASTVDALSGAAQARHRHQAGRSRSTRRWVCCSSSAERMVEAIQVLKEA